MSTVIANLPPVLGGTIPDPGLIYQFRTYNNPGDFYNGYPSQWQVDLVIQPISNAELPNYQFDASSISVGQWYVQPSGFCWRIAQIIPNATSGPTYVTVILDDVGLYNLLSDPAQQGYNSPQAFTEGVIFSISESGAPILTYLNNLIANKRPVA